jgi:hypothetical protein
VRGLIEGCGEEWGMAGRNVGGLIEGCRESRRSDYGHVEMAIAGMGAHDGG